MFYETHKIRTLPSGSALSRVYEEMKFFIMILSLISKNPLMDIIMIFRNDNWITINAFLFDYLKYRHLKDLSGQKKISDALSE
jgi:hypothetical protein